jgi:hypothetical protein
MVRVADSSGLCCGGRRKDERTNPQETAKTPPETKSRGRRVASPVRSGFSVGLERLHGPDMVSRPSPSSPIGAANQVSTSDRSLPDSPITRARKAGPLLYQAACCGGKRGGSNGTAGPSLSCASIRDRSESTWAKSRRARVTSSVSSRFNCSGDMVGRCPDEGPVRGPWDRE